MVYRHSTRARASTDTILPLCTPCALTFKSVGHILHCFLYFHGIEFLPFVVLITFLPTLLSNTGGNTSSVSIRPCIVNTRSNLHVYKTPYSIAINFLFCLYHDKFMGGGKGKKDVNAKLTTNFINILKYKTNHF
jgi:hypothetical protein